LQTAQLDHGEGFCEPHNTAFIGVMWQIVFSHGPFGQRTMIGSQRPRCDVIGSYPGPVTQSDAVGSPGTKCCIVIGS
jgi:hypothetical protein